MQVLFMTLNKTREKNKGIETEREGSSYFPVPQEVNGFCYSLSALSEEVPVEKGLKKSAKERKKTVPIKYTFQFTVWHSIVRKQRRYFKLST